MSKAYNRFSNEKAKNRAKRYLNVIGCLLNKRVVGKHGITRKICSCGVCKKDRYNRAKEKKFEDYW